MTNTAESVDVAPPTRFRAGEARAARIGRVLKRAGGVREIDEDLMAEIGRRFLRCDEVGAQLAQAIRRGDVRMSQFRLALEQGAQAVPDAPDALRAFFDHVETVPDWVDLDLLNQGARAYRRLAQNASDVMLQLALIGGYRFGGPTDLLVATGALTGDNTQRRMGETQKWGVAVSEHNGMLRGGEGWKLTVHVRAMHALVNDRFSDPGQWDIARWGLPVNQSDQASTLGLFDGALLLGVRALGVRVTHEDSRALMHLWKYVGWLMGVDEDWLVDDERARHRLNYHLLLAQDHVTPAGPQLANSILEAQPRLSFDRFAAAQRRYAPERLLSMLRLFLGSQGLKDLDLPVRLPWAVFGIIPKNLVLYYGLGRTAWGERYLERRGVRWRAQLMRRYFGDDVPDVAALQA